LPPNFAGERNPLSWARGREGGRGRV